MYGRFLAVVLIVINTADRFLLMWLSAYRIYMQFTDLLDIGQHYVVVTE